MRYKGRLIFVEVLSALFITYLGHAQQPNTAVVYGIVLDQSTGMPLSDVRVRIIQLKTESASLHSGYFWFSHIPTGSYWLEAYHPDYESHLWKVHFTNDSVDAGIIRLKPVEKVPEAHPDYPIAWIDPPDLEDGGITQGSDFGGLLTASRDPLLHAASFTWGGYGFRLRGYQQYLQEVWLQDLPMHHSLALNNPWQLWSGLNDMFRPDQQIPGLFNPDGPTGGIAGITYIYPQASMTKKQTKISYAYTNRQYRHRWMLTHHSGREKKGWAYSISASARMAQEGYIPGSFYNAYAFLGAISKKINNQEFSLLGFYTPTSRGGSSAITSEVKELSGNPYYNPNWGYQAGKKRNARVNNQRIPVCILQWKNSGKETMQWQLSLGYISGQISRSGLDWYHGKDPRPDYYRYLPSWQYLYYDEQPALAKQLAQQISEAWKTQTEVSQLNWDRFYEVNRNNQSMQYNAGGIQGNHVLGNRSVYVIGSQVIDFQDYMASVSFFRIWNPRWRFKQGLYWISQQANYYKRLDDLLGGDYFVNYNQFAENYHLAHSDFKQQDLHHPDRAVLVGERYQYDYMFYRTIASGWMHISYSYPRWEGFLAINSGYQQVQREGRYQNGLFPHHSYGKSKPHIFLQSRLKAGVIAKLSGRYFIYLNGMLGKEPPQIKNIYLMPSVHSQEAPGIQSQHIQSWEAGIQIRHPRLYATFSAYVTFQKNITEVQRFYHDDPLFRSFVSYVLSGAESQHRGIELGIEFVLTDLLTIKGALSWNQIVYGNNPEVWVFKENDTSLTAIPRQVFLKNYYVGTGPQAAYTLGMSYAHPKLGYIHLNGSYLHRNYIALAPERRSTDAMNAASLNEYQRKAILHQEELPGFYTLDIFLGKSFSIFTRLHKAHQRKYYLNFSLGINNILNNKEIISQGFEQLRFDFENYNPNKFPAKYYYAPGRTFFANISLKW